MVEQDPEDNEITNCLTTFMSLKRGELYHANQAASAGCEMTTKIAAPAR